MLRALFWSSTLLFVVLLLSGLTMAQETSAPLTHQPSAVAKGSVSESRPDLSEQQATRDDLQKMRVILNQMRNNLAFVGSSTTPLNHQLQLEIDMWQMLLDQMERRAGQGPESAPGR